jgi:DNA-binding GntR family transcriptional regulator
MSMTDVEEVYSLRAAIETLAVQLAVERATSDDLTTMRAIAAHNGGQSRAETAREFAELDVTFHDMIYQAARHAHLFSSWSLLRPHILRILTWRNLVNSDYQYICSVEHEELVECIADHDMHRAQALVRAHLHGAYQRLADAYRSRGGIAVEGEDPVAGGSVSTEPVWNGTNERLANNRAIGRDEGGTELLRSRDREERT